MSTPFLQVLGVSLTFGVLHKSARPVLCNLYTLPVRPNSARIDHAGRNALPDNAAVIIHAVLALSRVSVAVARFLCSGGIREYPTGVMQWRAIYAAIRERGIKSGQLHGTKNVSGFMKRFMRQAINNRRGRACLAVQVRILHKIRT